MPNQISAIVERDSPCYIVCCVEVPGVNRHGKAREKCIEVAAVCSTSLAPL